MPRMGRLICMLSQILLLQVTGKSEPYLYVRGIRMVWFCGWDTLSLGTKRYICIPYDVLVQTQVDGGRK